MHFVLQTPPLQHVVGVNIVTHLWNQRDILTQIAGLFNSRQSYLLTENTKQWKEIDEKVRDKIWALSLPESCKKQLLHFVKPLGLEIIRWCLYHTLGGSSELLNTLLTQPFCWTMHGVIDYAKTAELMVRDEKVNVERRYEIACLICLEDEAGELFESMGEERRQECVNKVRSASKMDHLTFFTCTLAGEARLINSIFGITESVRSDSVDRVLFIHALLNGGAMCEYWFKRLSPGEKERVLEDRDMELISLRQSRASNFLRYSSWMDEEQRERMFGERTRYVLKAFLRWPMQSLFVEAAECGWQLMDEEDCARVLNFIIYKIRDAARDYDYCQLFWECWRLTTSEYKRYFLNNVCSFDGLIATKEEDFIKFVFNDAPSHRLKEIVENKYEKISRVLMDESVISDAALLECKQAAAFNSESDEEDAEKRLRSQHLKRLVDKVMEWRLERRSSSRFDSS